MNKNIIKKPNLFIVGFPKSGTTSFHDYLSEHPEIYMSKWKEPGYFSFDLKKNISSACKKKEDYLKLFQTGKNVKIIGESSTSYIYSKEAAKNIFSFNPDSKIIIIIREPVEFLYSLHAQYLSDGIEWEINFKNALELEKNRKKNGSSPLLLYSERIKYTKQIQRYLDIFGNNNVKIILFDDIKLSLSNEYEKVLKFLNLKNIFFKPDFTIKNKRTVPNYMFLHKIIKNPDLKIKIFLKKILRKKTIVKLYLTFLNLNLKKNKDTLDYNLKKKLMKKVKPEIVKLNNLLHENNLINKNIDLINLWGYDKLK